MQGYWGRQFQPESGTELESLTAAVLRVKLNVLVTAKLLNRVAKKSFDFWGKTPILNHFTLFFEKK